MRFDDIRHTGEYDAYAEKVNPSDKSYDAILINTPKNPFLAGSKPDAFAGRNPFAHGTSFNIGPDYGGEDAVSGTSSEQKELGRFGVTARSFPPVNKAFTKCAHGQPLMTSEQLDKLEEAITRREEIAAQLERDRAAQEALESAARAGLMALDKNGNFAVTREDAVTEGETIEDVVTDSNAVEDRTTAVMNKTGGEGIQERSVDVSARNVIAGVRAEASNLEATVESAETSHAGHGHGPAGPAL